MFDRLAELEAELEQLEADLPGIMASGDRAASRDAGRRHAELRPIIDAYHEYQPVEQDLADARELLAAEDDSEMREFLAAEVKAKEEELLCRDAELREMLVPRDPN